jgi:hypothetical protein
MADMARFELLRFSELPGDVGRSHIVVRFGSCDPAGMLIGFANQPTRGHSQGNACGCSD